jgi:hypothetical protein
MIGIVVALVVGLGLGYFLFSGGGMMGGSNVGASNMGASNMGEAKHDGDTMADGMAAGDHSQMMQQPSGVANDATAAFQAANQKMHTDMAITFTGDADVDFVTGMIPHHQGAIDMAKVVIQHGHDAQIKKLGEDIIAAQESEIAFMKDWLAKNKH